MRARSAAIVEGAVELVRPKMMAVIPAIYGLVKQWRLKRGMEG